MWPAWRDVPERLVVYEVTYEKKKKKKKTATKGLYRVLDHGDVDV